MKIELREVIDSDLEIFFQNQLDPEANNMAAFTSEDPTDREKFDAFWDRIRKNPTVMIKTILVDETVVGSVLKYEMEGDQEISYWVSKETWGKGITSKAVGMFLNDFKVRPVFARVAFDNLGSIKVLEKNGFQRISIEKGFANARGKEIEEFVYRLD